MNEPRARTGDALDDQVLSHVGLIRHVGQASLRGQHDLDDFTQTVLVAAYAGRERLRRVDHLGRWIAGIARNVARDWNRTRTPVLTADLPDVPSPDPRADRVLEDRERWERVVDALSALPASERELLRSHYLDERGHGQLQDELGVSGGAVRVRLTRARQSLRRKLGVVSGLVAWFSVRPTARAFGELPARSGRMSTPFSLMTSTLIVGWLGLGAHVLERSTVDLAMSSAHSDTPPRVVQLHKAVAPSRPKVTPIPKAPVGEGEQRMSDLLDIVPAATFSTVVGVLHGMFEGAGNTDWSKPRLMGVLGYAFSFEMRKGGGVVWQESNLDWGAVFHVFPELGVRIRRYEVKHREEPGDSTALKTEAWDAVRASIDRGIPAAAWNPMSLRQKEAGLRAFAWGLLVGYNESEGTYSVRHRAVPETFTVPFDAIGHTDGVEWFCVLVYDGPASGDDRGAHITALRNAVAFAHGTRFDSLDPKDLNYPVDALGFAALELWRAGIEDDEASPEASQYNAGALRSARGYAAGYLRELVDVLPKAASDLEAAATHYDRVVDTSDALHGLCGRAKEQGEFSEDTRTKAVGLVAAALQADRDAIASIEGALAMLGTSH